MKYIEAGEERRNSCYLKVVLEDTKLIVVMKKIMRDWIKQIVENKVVLLNELETTGYLDLVEKAGEQMVEALKNGNKIILAGNGGSAADAQHFAGEIVGRFTMERNPLPAMSLCVDPTIVTCIANDYGYDEVFARQIAGQGKKGDIFVAISTSGNSENCIRAMKVAKEMGITVIGFLGKDGGKMKDLCDNALVVPSNITPRIQETHTLTLHILCELIEKDIFGTEK